MSNTPTTLLRIREVFGSSAFRRLFATRAVSQLGDGIFQLAAADILLFDKSGPNPAVKLAIASALTLVPFSIIGPFVGVFIDRWERRNILAVTPLVRAALAALVMFGIGKHNQGALFYTIVLVVLSANRLFLATISAVLPQTVPENDLLVANSVASTGGSLTNVTGLGLGAALSSLFGGTRAAGVAAIAFVAGGIIAMRVPVHRGIEAPETGPMLEEIKIITREMMDGARRMADRSRVRFAMSAVVMNQFLVGAMTGATVAYFIRDLHLQVGSVTTLLAVLAVGIGIGIVVVPVIGEHIRHDAIIPLSFALAAAAVTISGLFLSHASVVAGSVAVGVAYAMTKIPVDTIVQEELPDSHRGRAFAAYDMLFNVSRVAGTAAIAAIVGASVGSHAIVIGIGLSYLGCAAFAALAERRSSGPSQPHEPPVQAAPVTSPVTVGEMITVRTYSGHRRDAEPRALVIGGKEIAIDEIVWRAIEERLTGERRQIFVVDAAGMRIRIASGDESSRWEVESVRDVIPAPS